MNDSSACMLETVLSMGFLHEHLHCWQMSGGPAHRLYVRLHPSVH